MRGYTPRLRLRCRPGFHTHAPTGPSSGTDPVLPIKATQCPNMSLMRARLEKNGQEIPGIALLKPLEQVYEPRSEVSNKFIVQANLWWRGTIKVQSLETRIRLEKLKLSGATVTQHPVITLRGLGWLGGDIDGEVKVQTVSIPSLWNDFDGKIHLC